MQIIILLKWAISYFINLLLQNFNINGSKFFKLSFTLFSFDNFIDNLKSFLIKSNLSINIFN